jgi:hypothetical protein
VSIRLRRLPSDLLYRYRTINANWGVLRTTLRTTSSVLHTARELSAAGVSAAPSGPGPLNRVISSTYTRFRASTLLQAYPRRSLYIEGEIVGKPCDDMGVVHLSEKKGVYYNILILQI